MNHKLFFTHSIGSLHLIERGALHVPAWLREDGLVTDSAGASRHPNLSAAARRYLERLGLGVEDLFHHVLATLHDPAYRAANAGALRMEWPRIPLPGWPNGGSDGAAAELARSAARGRELARLLDPDAPAPGVTTGTPRPELVDIAVPATADDHNMTGDDFAVTAGWGHAGSGDAVMPGQGRTVERACTAKEREALRAAPAAFGDGAAPRASGNDGATPGGTTFDIYLNADAFWRNVPPAVWRYKLGGYQVLKKWLSYRERTVLGRALKPDEVLQFTEIARRIAAILALTSSGSRVKHADR